MLGKEHDGSGAPLHLAWHGMAWHGMEGHAHDNDTLASFNKSFRGENLA